MQPLHGCLRKVSIDMLHPDQYLERMSLSVWLLTNIAERSVLVRDPLPNYYQQRKYILSSSLPAPQEGKCKRLPTLPMHQEGKCSRQLTPSIPQEGECKRPPTLKRTQKGECRRSSTCPAEGERQISLLQSAKRALGRVYHVHVVPVKDKGIVILTYLNIMTE